MALPPPDGVSEQDLILSWMRGDKAATRFCLEFLEIIHLWDDLVDKDVDRTEADVNRVFRLLFDLPLNGFYYKHYFDLNPVITTGINSWIAANDMEREQGNNDLHVAYTLRCNILSVLVHCAQIIGGNEWAEEVSHQIWRYGMREPFAVYEQEMKKRREDNA